jgi:cytochrome c-type biogenesis protein CcsB
MNTTTQSQPQIIAPRGAALNYFNRKWTDWLFAALITALTIYAFMTYGAKMDFYERAILAGTAPSVIALAWGWRSLQPYLIVCGLFALVGIASYSGDITRAEKVFWLKYMFSSQSAILWMCVLFFFATVAYWVGLVARKETPLWMGTAFTWGACVMGLTGWLVRWREGHLLGPDIGHIPVSNLYEVFVVFALMTALFYLYYEQRHKTRALGPFVSLVVLAAVGFLLWYSFDRGAHEIQPLVPALQSWWMKIHVPANFVGYGTFSLAAMVAYAYIIKAKGETASRGELLAMWFFGMAMFLMFVGPMALRSKNPQVDFILYPAIAAGISFVFVWFRRPLAARIPALELLDDVMYKAIAVGFAFFTIATILGALWAAEAWGAYWQWDPKETWALIVWLNYAAWLHMRFIKGLRGVFAAYWALVGLLITGFAFLGVNMFLSGLHSYGQL